MSLDMAPEALEGLRGIEDVPPASTANAGLAPIQLDDFLALNIPPRPNLLSPWLREKSVSMLYAPRGVGKTWTALSVAYAVASGGSFLRWTAPKAVPVMYLDGEMAAGDLQDRLSRIVSKAPNRSPADLRVVAADLSEDGLPCLATEAGQRAVINALGDTKLVVVDNIATLVRVSKSNEAESWAPVQNFALRLRRRGVSTLFIHHSGKSGDQRGTSAKEDVMDSVVRLTRPDDYDPAEGARFTVEYTKARGFYGEDATSFEARLNAATGEWETSDPAPGKEEQILDLALDGKLTQRQIAERAGCSVGYVNKVLSGQKRSGAYR